jgi:hypothetical protein
MTMNPQHDNTTAYADIRPNGTPAGKPTTTPNDNGKQLLSGISGYVFF